jgi:hypothetical protein
VTEQGYPPRQPDRSGRPGRTRVPPEPRTNGWQMLDAFDGPADPEADSPPWAIPGGIEPIRPARRTNRSAPPPEPPQEEDIAPAQPARSVRRPGRSRAAATRRRRSRRRLLTWGVVAIVVVILAGVSYFISRPGPQLHPYVTALQKGEYGSVPDACAILSTAALTEYLGGKPSNGVQSAAGGGKSDCTYQFDAKPTFRVLELTITAYMPSLIAPGNGSATSYAIYTFGQTKAELVQPPKDTPEPPAKISSAGGIGNESFGALQVYHVGSVQDRISVLARWHNVLIDASIWATVGSGFGPVSIPQLESYVQQVTRTTLKAVKAERAVTS